MNPEQQRIAIAEACGWKVLEPEVKPAITYLWGLRECFIHEENKEIIPEYLNNLNAMHKAEKTLDANQCAEYARKLMAHHPTYCVTVLDNRFAPTEEIAYQTYQLLHTTAAQRAEAFLRTIGKWKEAK